MDNLVGLQVHTNYTVAFAWYLMAMALLLAVYVFAQRA
jgi:hypothetical protein